MVNNININKVLENGTYHDLKESLYTELSTNFEKKDNIVDFIVNGIKTPLHAGEALVNLILFQLYKELPSECMDGILLRGENFSSRALTSFINHYIECFVGLNSDRGRHDIAQDNIALVVDDLAQISVIFNVKAGNTICLQDFVHALETYPETKELFCPDINMGTVDFKTIENMFNDSSSKIYSYLKKHKEHCLSVFANSDTGINKKQLVQTVGFVGLKPDMNGHVIPVVIDENFMNGLQNIEHYFVTTKSARKASTTNFKFVRVSGYLARKLSLALSDVWHDDSVEDCGTTHFIRYKVDSLAKLNKIDGRNFYLLDDKGQPSSALIKMNVNSFKYLADNTAVIGLRSPTKCRHEHACRTCYGNALSDLNRDINTGIFAVESLTKFLTQKLLSSKHLLSVVTSLIKWGDVFEKYFAVNLDEVLLTDESVAVTVMKSDIQEDEDDGTLFTDVIHLRVDKKTTIVYNSPVSLYLNMDVLCANDNGTYTFTALENVADDPIFYIDIRNNELIASLVKVIELIENDNHLNVQNLDELVNTFADLLIENDLDVMSVHAEMIASTMARDTHDHSRRPDFSKDAEPDYSIDRISKVIMNMPLGKSLAFERIKEQLSKPETYAKRKPSIMDHLFE